MLKRSSALESSSGWARNKKLLAPVLALVLSGGCALLAPRPAEEQVRERAEEHLDHLRRGEFEAAWSYTTPGYRQTNTWQDYGRQNAGVTWWLSAQVDTVTCSPVDAAERCEVEISLVYRAPGQRWDKTTRRQKVWIALDGEWYLVEK